MSSSSPAHECVSTCESCEGSVRLHSSQLSKCRCPRPYPPLTKFPTTLRASFSQLSASGRNSGIASSSLPGKIKLGSMLAAPSRRAMLSISYSASRSAQTISRGRRNELWVTVTIWVTIEVETLNGEGKSRHRISDMVRLHEGQWRFEMRSMVATCV